MNDTITFSIYGLPRHAVTLNEWVVWAGGLAIGLTAIAIFVRSIFRFVVRFRARTAQGVRELLKEDFAALRGDIEAMKVENAEAHAATSTEMRALTERLDAHLLEASATTRHFNNLAQLVETHMGIIAKNLVDPGLAENTGEIPTTTTTETTTTTTSSPPLGPARAKYLF